MSIRIGVFRKPPVATESTNATIVGVTMQPTGSAIVSISLDPRQDQRHPVRRCTGIERLPYDVGKVTARIKSLDSADLIVVDGAGAGQAIWIALDSPRDGRFELYRGQGRERQKLVDPFPAMMIDGTFSFAAGLEHQEAMLKALAGYKREVLDDGVVGNELAIALFLAVGHRPRPALFIGAA